MSLPRRRRRDARRARLGSKVILSVVTSDRPVTRARSLSQRDRNPGKRLDNVIVGSLWSLIRRASLDDVSVRFGRRAQIMITVLTFFAARAGPGVKNIWCTARQVRCFPTAKCRESAAYYAARWARLISVMRRTTGFNNRRLSVFARVACGVKRKTKRKGGRFRQSWAFRAIGRSVGIDGQAVRFSRQSTVGRLEVSKEVSGRDESPSASAAQRLCHATRRVTRWRPVSCVHAVAASRAPPRTRARFAARARFRRRATALFAGNAT